MRRLLIIAQALGVVASATAFVAVHDVPEGAEANHSAPGSIDTHIAHVHDNYYHPEPLTGPWPDHAAAQADCQSATPPVQCDMTIEVSDSVEWWTKAPFHSAPHTVTECTDNTFSNCGATADSVNPIDDSGVFPGASVDAVQYGPITFTTPGTYYYYCSIHPDVMRGRIVVSAQQTPTPSPTPAPSVTTSPAGSPTIAPTGVTPPTSPSPSQQLPAAAPQTGGGPSSGASSWVWIATSIGGAMLAAATAGVGLLRRR